MSDTQSSGPYELNVDTELVRMIVVKARAAMFTMPDAEDDDPEETMEIDSATSIESEDEPQLAEERAEDATQEEASAMIDSLNVDEQAEIIALTWIGRGDFEAEEIEETVRTAKQRASGPASTYLFGMEIFPSHLSNGLDAYEEWRAKQPD